MEMIRDLPGRMVGRWMKSWGLFRCPICGKEVEKERYYGRKNKSCGCLRALSARKPNRIKILGDVAIIFTSKNEEIFVDSCDIEILGYHRWHVKKKDMRATKTIKLCTGC